MEAHLRVLPFLNCTYIDAYAHTHTKIPSSRRVKRAIWGNAWKVSRQMIPAVCNRAITTWSCFTNLKYKSFHHRWVWAFFRDTWFIDCSCMCTLVSVWSSCQFFCQSMLSVAIQRERDEWIEQGREEPTWRNMGGELPWSGPLPQPSGYGEQHCSQHRWWTCVPG